VNPGGAMKQLLVCAALPIAACSAVETPALQNSNVGTLSLLPQTSAESPQASVQSIWDQLSLHAGPLCEELQSVMRHCTFSLSILNEPLTGPDAKSWVDGSGNAQVSINMQMLSLLQGADEVAFVLAHEMAHAIAGHHSGPQIRSFENGFTLGGNQNHRIELEADGLGAILAARAGFDPIRGMQILTRLSAGGQSHPLADTRMSLVSSVAATLARGEEISLN